MEELIKEKIAKALEDLNNHGLSLAKIGAKIGVSEGTIKNWLIKKTCPSAIELKKIADVSSKKVFWFYGLEEPAPSPEPTESILELKRDRDAWRAEAEEWKGRCKALEEKKCTVSKQKKHPTY